MIDCDLIQRKIALILQDLEHLVKYKTVTVGEMGKDFLQQVVIERLLERVIGRAIDINQHIIAEHAEQLAPVKTYRDTFMRLVELGIYSEAFAKQLAPCAGLRNAIVHEYNNLDPLLLQKSIGHAITELNEYTKCVLTFIDSVNTSGT